MAVAGAFLPLDGARAGCSKVGGEITCSGTTSLTDAPAAEAASGESVTNTGTLTVTGSAPYALFGTSQTTLTNTGSVTTSGASLDALEVLGDENTLRNGGSVTTQGASSDGLRAVGNRNTLTNTGQIATQGQDARAIAADGNGNTLVNSGRITTEGLGGEGMNASGAENSLTNSGRIETTGPVGNGMRAFGSRNVLLNTGTIITHGLEARGIKIDGGSDTRVVNRGSITTSGTDAFGVWVASTAGQKNTVINEAGGTITAGGSFALKSGDGDDRFENYGRLVSGIGAAADLGAGQDTFLIGASSNITGYVDAGSGTDTFALGGSATGSLSVDLIGPMAQYRNFEAYEKVGSSLWTLTGTNNEAMPWAVKEGTLMVVGTMGGSAMTVSAGATLGGTGTVGSIDARAGSTLTPGVGGIGSLHVNGNVLIANGTIYRIDLNAGLQSDRIVAKGAATVEGGLVRVSALPGDYKPGSRWTILSAEGGVTGQFSGVTTNLAFFKPLLTKDEDNIYLVLRRRNRPLPDSRPVIAPYLPVTVGELPRVLDLTSGEALASATGAILAHDDLFRAAVLCRLRCSLGGLPSLAASNLVYADYAADLPQRRAPASVLVAPQRQNADWAVWGKAIGSWGSTEATGTSYGVERRTAGLVAGVDTGLGTPYRLGLAAGYFSTDFSVGALGSSGNVESFHIGAYGSASFGMLNIRGGVAYAHHEVDLSRTIAFTGFSGTSRSSSAADSFQAFGEIGYTFLLSQNVAIEPFAGLAYVHVSSRNIREEGSAVDLTGRVHDFDTLFSTLGLRMIATLPTEAGLVTFKGLVGWRHAFGDVVPKATFAYASGSTPFLVTGAPIDRDSLVFEAGLNWEVRRDVTLSVSYSGAVGRRDQEHTLRAGLTVRF